ncbi:MAG: hypothetical protein ACREOY_11150 [Candidatus Dormibacteraceae bacterium]
MIRRHSASVLDLIVALCVIASVASPWWISVPPAHLPETFGFQAPACWLMVIALFAALFLSQRVAVIALAFVELVLIAWFGWAMLVVTTPRFTSLGFPFIGTDLIGPGWYAAAVGLLVAAALVVQDLNKRDVPVGWDLWVLTALPGYGLVRLGRWSSGLAWTALFSAALYFASTDSPDPSQFTEYGGTGNVPPAYPREPEWVLLTLAGVLFVMSVAATAWRRRKELSTGD